ncbi:MAG TPA: M23 family metallopeptidase, partial [Acidimicrobiales bacterium]|nr:M23 family metallopeptidase [Acidimicrobiales bacterium]
PATEPRPDPGPTTSTTAKDPAVAPAPPAPAKTGAEKGDSAGDPPPGAPKVVPPSARAAIGAVKRSGPNSTRKLIEALRPLQSLGLTRQEAIQLGFGRFPVGGYAHYTHDWLNPRFTPTFHLHEGTDVFATSGTPVRSPADGTLRQSQGAVGGLAAYVHEPNGTFYYLAHLQGFVPGQRSGQRVEVGDVIGYNGDSGNARGGPPHVHFEIHPRGGGPTDPKPYLDRWLDEALADVPRLIESLEAGRPRALISTGLTRHLATGSLGAFVAPVSPPRPHLLWAFSASPPGGALRLAEAEAAVAARDVDWSALTRRREGVLEAHREAEATARNVLAPLTPPSLHQVLGLT